MKKTLLILTSAVCISATAQTVTTFAGNTGSGSYNGTGTSAAFSRPYGVALDGNGNLFVADNSNHMIRKIVLATGVVTTLAGSTSSGSTDGIGTAASFNYPTGVACDGNGNLFVADYGNNTIRQVVIATGAVTTLAGGMFAGASDGTGTSAKFNNPFGVVCDNSGNLYVADLLNNEIRKIVVSTGVVTTIAGSTFSGSNNGTGTSASFNNPSGLAYDGNGNLYIADDGNHMIRKMVLSTGVVTTVAGSTTPGSFDGIGTNARFNFPENIAYDGNGSLFVTDQLNNEIRQIDISTGMVTTVAGSTTYGSADGTGAAAQFHYPVGIACDGNGYAYIGDDFNNEIRKMSVPSVGMEEMKLKAEEVNIYPNPANGFFTVSTNATAKQTVQVFDVNGKLILSKTINASATIDAAELNAGVYSVCVLCEGGIVTRRLVIAK